MPAFVILITLEILTYLVLKEHFRTWSKTKYFAIQTINFTLSIILWYFFIRSVTFKDSYDNPQNISFHMNLAGMICGVVVPRFILSLLHYLGKLLRIRRGTHIRGLTNAGLIISFFIGIVIACSAFIGRFNFRTENVTIKVKGLKPGLNGLRIVQISDLHLSSFYNHYNQLRKAVGIINNLKPDILLNTGDFVSFGPGEFDSVDTILASAKSRYGSFAILGNHDIGTYIPGATLAEKADIVMKVSDKIRSSGYQLLHDSNTIIDIGGVKVAFIGVITGGKHSAISHGDPRKAMIGTDSADFKVFMCHDPNQWEADIARKTNISLTFSGHTHGMQMGIMTKWLKWSPARHFYPHWNGLYSEGNQYQYVNRGLGTLAVPIRIWMPPEITLVTLVAE